MKTIMEVTCMTFSELKHFAMTGDEEELQMHSKQLFDMQRIIDTALKFRGLP